MENTPVEELASYLTDAEFRRLAALPLVEVHPPAPRDDPYECQLLAVALRRTLIRNLMLLRDVSVRGPEDSPLVPADVLEAPSAERALTRITGRTFMDGTLRVEFRLLRHSGDVDEARAAGESFAELALASSDVLTRALGATADQQVRTRWRGGLPAHLRSALQYGEALQHLRLDTEEHEPARVARVHRVVFGLRRTDPDYIAPSMLLDGDYVELQPHLMTALSHDPDDPQLYFNLFLATWHGGTDQPEAFRCLRRGLELSPAHGKAHMCAAHVGPPSVDLVRHAELGYILLPGNEFALTSLTASLRRRGGDPERVIQLCREGIELNELDPAPLQMLIGVLREQRRFAEAIEAARELCALFSPPMHPHTFSCLSQNPARAEALRSGSYDPYALAQELLAELEAEAAS